MTVHCRITLLMSCGTCQLSHFHTQFNWTEIGPGGIWIMCRWHWHSHSCCITACTAHCYCCIVWSYSYVHNLVCIFQHVVRWGEVSGPQQIGSICRCSSHDHRIRWRGRQWVPWEVEAALNDGINAVLLDALHPWSFAHDLDETWMSSDVSNGR